MKVKQFFDFVFPSDKSLGELNVIAQDILDEYPISAFNAILMEYFDAALTCSEGNVESATLLTKHQYAQIEEWHRILREFKLTDMTDPDGIPVLDGRGLKTNPVVFNYRNVFSVLTGFVNPSPFPLIFR